MPLTESFYPEPESRLGEEFLSSAYVIRDVEDRAALDMLRSKVVGAAAKAIGIPAPEDESAFLNEFHHSVPVDKLNAIRLGLYRELNSNPWFRPTYLHLARRIIEGLVGNELAMQNRINLSIQMPEDRTSLLDLHADSFGGETPFQVVQWLPLVDVSATKSMFILPRQKSEEIIKRLKDFSKGGMRALYETVKNDLIWLDIPYGKVLVFSPNVLHGNIINEETTTRWSFNTRFTGLFTPYGSAEKTLGSYYLPITPRPVTRIGVDYQTPDGFEE